MEETAKKNKKVIDKGNDLWYSIIVVAKKRQQRKMKKLLTTAERCDNLSKLSQTTVNEHW